MKGRAFQCCALVSWTTFTQTHLSVRYVTVSGVYQSDRRQSRGDCGKSQCARARSVPAVPLARDHAALFRRRTPSARL